MNDRSTRRTFAFGAALSSLTPIGVVLIWRAMTDVASGPLYGLVGLVFLALGLMGSAFAYYGVCILIYRALKAGDIQ